MSKKYSLLGPLASLRESNISFHFLQLFLTFPLFFDTFHQNHPKTTPLFNRISPFLTTFCRFLSLFHFRFRANSAQKRERERVTQVRSFIALGSW
jgi:hypothetical protein